MTIKDLEEYRDIKNEIRQINTSIGKLLNNKNALVSDTVKGSSQSFPYSERVIQVSGVLGHKYDKAYKKRMSTLETRLSCCIDKISEIDSFVDTITNSKIRQIIELRYIQGLSWLVVSRKVYNYPSENRARMAVTRFFAEI